MSGTAELTGLYAAIEESARLVDATCSRDKVWPILTAYGDSLAQAVIAFRVATDERRAGELDCRFTMLPKDVDPYAVALSNGLTARTVHPVDALLSDMSERFPIDCYGIDFGVVDGFKKTWSFFPPDNLQGLAKLADLASMPRSMGDNLDFFARHGLDNNASLIGIDYPSRTVNVYFGEISPECFEPKTILSILREIDLPDPSEEMLKLGEHAFGIYVTLGWDSSRIERITFAVMTPDPATLPVRLDPKIAQFARRAPYTYDAADRRFVYAVTSSKGGEYYKLQSYYQWRPQMLNLMLLADSAEDLA
jgi:Aromatic prenyltransferase Orf2